MSRALWIAAAAVLVLVGTAVLMRGEIAVFLARGQMERAFAADPLDALPDGLHALVCGSGSPLADAQRAGPCLAVIAGRRLIVVDVGEGAAERLQLSGAPPARVERVLLTHMHSDHMDGLGALALQRWAGGSRTDPLPLMGPAGVEQVAAGLNAAYALDRGYRIAHHGPTVVPPSGYGLAALPFPPPAPGRPVVVLDDGGLRITAFSVSHAPVSPAAVGYRFDYKGRSLSVSGDTAKSESLINASKGVDLMIHEALSPRLVGMMGEAARKGGRENLAKIMDDIPGYHASPEDAAASAAAAGARALLLTHMIPPLPLKALEGPFLGRARTAYDGPLWIAQDGDLLTLRPGVTSIERSRLP